jgi:hypothetical protein
MEPKKEAAGQSCNFSEFLPGTSYININILVSATNKEVVHVDFDINWLHVTDPTE